jgi:hypothetical protein
VVGEVSQSLDLVEVFEGQGEWQLAGEVMCGGVIGKSCGDHRVSDSDLDRYFGQVDRAAGQRVPG